MRVVSRVVNVIHRAASSKIVSRPMSCCMSAVTAKSQLALHIPQKKVSLELNYVLRPRTEKEEAFFSFRKLPTNLNQPQPPRKLFLFFLQSHLSVTHSNKNKMSKVASAKPAAKKMSNAPAPAAAAAPAAADAGVAGADEGMFGEDGGNNIKVCIRVRPFIEREKGEKSLSRKIN